MTMGMRVREMLLRTDDRDSPAAPRSNGVAAAAPARAVAARQARLRLATDVVMLLLAGTIESLSASAASVSTEPTLAHCFGAVVLALLALRGRYRAVISRASWTTPGPSSASPPSRR